MVSWFECFTIESDTRAARVIVPRKSASASSRVVYARLRMRKPAGTMVTTRRRPCGGLAAPSTARTAKWRATSMSSGNANEIAKGIRLAGDCLSGCIFRKRSSPNRR